MQIELGVAVEATDGPCGTVGDVVISPRRRSVTASALVLRLAGPAAGLDRYPEVEDHAYVRMGDWPVLEDPRWDVGVSDVLVPIGEADGVGAGWYTALPSAEGVFLTTTESPPVRSSSDGPRSWRRRTVPPSGASKAWSSTPRGR